MLSEVEGTRVLKEVFTRRGYAIVENVHLEDDDVSFDIDGWDAAAKVGYEYRTHEAEDADDLETRELIALAGRMERGELYIFVIDDEAIADAAELVSYAERFLDEVARRRGKKT